MADLISFIYNKLLRSEKFHFLFNLFRKIILLFSDIEIKANVRNIKLWINISHNLPIYIRYHQYYDTLLPRLSRYLYEKEKYLSMIDVGSNIGDSVVIVYNYLRSIEMINNKIKYHCVEGDERYLRLFKKIPAISLI